MAWTIKFADGAIKELKKIDKQGQKEIQRYLKDRITTDLQFGTNRFERSITGEMNRLDAGFGVHLKYHFFGRPGAQIRVGYQRGLVDIYKSEDLTAYNDAIQFAVLIPITLSVR